MTDAEFDAAIAALAPWVGRTRIVEDEIGLSSARRIAGMLDMDPASITQGMALPPHRHEGHDASGEFPTARPHLGSSD